MPSAQYELNLEAGLTDQHETFGDAIRASVYGCPKQLKAVAADLDLSSSMLSRMLNDADPSVNFPAHRLPELIAATGSLLPVHWLIERFCQDEDEVQRQAMRKLASMLPDVMRAMERAGLTREGA